VKSKVSYFFQGVWNNILNKIPSYRIRHFLLKHIYRMDIGDSTVHMNVKFYSPWNIKIGECSNVQRDCFLDGRGGLVVHDNVDITPGVQIITMSHCLDDPMYSSCSKSVVIHKNSVIFTSSIILPGVTIGEGGCIGAGSVVSKSTEPYSVYCGNPAKFIKHRNSDIRYSVRYERFFH